MNNFALEVERLTVSFDGFKAVDDVSFYLTRGTVHVVIGPNGAGKTTLLDLICGKTKPTSGSIRFEGTELTKLAESPQDGPRVREDIRQSVRKAPSGRRR